MTDISKLSDSELMAALNAPPTTDLGKMSDAELMTALGKPSPSLASVSTGEDVLRSGGIGLAKGAIAGLGTPGDAANLLARGSKIAGDYIGGMLGSEPSPPLAPPLLPTSGGIQKAVEGQTGEFYKPKTGLGHYAETAGEFVGNPTSYISPGGMLGKAATAAGAGIGSEVGGQLTKGNPQLEPIARLIGAMAGAHGVAATPRITAAGSPEVNVLRKESIPLTAGDITGRTQLRAAESELSPGVNEAQKKAFEQAAFSKVGETIGDRPITGQNGAVDSMMKRIGSQFDALASRNSLVADQPLAADLKNIHDTYAGTPGIYPAETVNAVNGAIQRVSDSLGKTGGTLAGKEYQDLRSNFRAAAQGTSDPQRATALHEITNALDDAVERSIAKTNPRDSGAWADARKDYRNALVLQQWAGSANMTPSTLAQAAKSVYGKNAYVRGMDDFSELADAGRSVMKQYQDSGTARRVSIENLLKGVGAAGGALVGGHQFGAHGAVEGGVLGLLLGETAGPFAVRPAARAALMNPLTQAMLSHKVEPYRFGNNASIPALVNAMRGGQ